MFSVYKACFDSRHSPDFSVNRSVGYPCYLLLFARTSAYFTFEETEMLIKPGTIIIFSKHSPYICRSCGTEYTDDWVQFDGSRILMDSWNIPFDKPVETSGVFNASEYIKLISDSFLKRSDYGTGTEIIRISYLVESSREWQLPVQW